MLFVSKIRNLRLIKRPSDRVKDEASGNFVYNKGERVEFDNWRYSTNNQDLVNWLCGHSLYGREFTSDKVQDSGVDPEIRAKLYADDLLAHPKGKLDEGFKNTLSKNSRLAKILKQQVKNPPMLRGSMATAWGTKVNDKAKPDEIDVTAASKALTEEKIGKMIDDKIGTAMADILAAIKQNQAPAPAKRKFHCTECGKEFATGIAVGKHKKVAHAVPTSTSEVT